MDNCTLNCIEIQGHLNYDDMCSFTQDQCNQDTIQFVQGYYCLMHGSFMILVFIGLPLFVFLFKGLNVIAEEYLSPCVDQFIHEFKISPTLAGVTFLAFANGAPDVMTAIIAGSSDSNTTALIPFGSIFGACLFSMAFILAEVIIAQPNETLSIKLQQVVLPLSFYVLGIVFIIFVTVIYGKMNIYLASVLLLFYIIYIVFVLKAERDTKKKQSLLMSGLQAEQQDKKPEKDAYCEKQQALKSEDKVVGNKIINLINDKIVAIQNAALQFIVPFYKLQQWNPLKAVITLIVSPFIIALTQDFPHILGSFIGPVPVFLIICFPSFCLLIYVIYCIIRKQQPYFMKVFTIYSFIVSVSALTVVCSILINLVQLVQILTGINSVFLGLTVFAWANSIGDYLTITHFAKKGNPNTAVAGIFSGQLFNFLLGFGVSLMIQSINGSYEYKIFDFEGTAYDKISDAIVMSVIVAGLVYLVFALIVSIRNKGILMRREALFARWYYAAFILISCFLAVLTDFFSDIQCDM